MTYFLITSCAVGLLGCDPGDMSVTATATATEGGGGTDSSGGAEGSSTSGTETGQSTDGPVCEDLLGPDEFGPGASFRIRNDSDVAIWVGAVGECFGDPAFRLLDDADTIVNHIGSCLEPLCESVVGSTECFLGCPDCGNASAIRIAPGGEGELSWSGRRLTQAEVPEACLANDECPTVCAMQTEAPAGLYSVELDVYTSCEGDCECEVGDEFEGVCRLFSATTLTGTPEVRSIDLDYPAQTDVTLVYGS